MINPWTNAEAYFKFKIGTTDSPGIVVASDGWASAWKWDEKGGKGTKKANLTHTGQQLASGSFTVELWLPSHANEWEAFYALCRYDTDKTPAGALNLYYPTVSITGVRAVVTTEITPMMPAGRGKWRSKFSFKEWVPAPKKNATSTPTGSGNGPRTEPRALEGGDYPGTISGEVRIGEASLDDEARRG
jgi:hypothetical protein